MRAYKTVNDTYIEPISFTVPRRAETFQSDIYPPATGLKPAVSAREWVSGKTAVPAKIDLESIYDGNAPVEVPSDYKPPATAPAPAPAPAAKAPPKREPEPQASAARSPPPSMKEQKQSISAMANKFQDDEGDEDDEDETSSFEEVGRPKPRTVPARAEKPPSPVKAAPAVQAQPPSPVKSPKASWSPPTARSAAATSSSGPSSGSVEASLEQIKQLLATQTKIINSQSDKISQLASDVDTLKKKVGTGSQDQSERIRQLELELEAARS